MFRPLVLLASMLMVTGLVGATPAAAAPPEPSAINPPSAPWRADPASATVTLPTGQLVRVTRDSTGRERALVLPGTGPGESAYLTPRINGHLFVIPHSELPQITSAAAFARFDVTAMATGVPSPLAAPDDNRGSHRYPMRTLRITGIDQLGHPPTGLAMFYLVLNVDDGRRFATFTTMANGSRNISVPVGHYTVIGFFSRLDNTTGGFDDRVVTVPELTVSNGHHTTDVTLDARTATHTLAVTTPRPATMRIMDAQVVRSDAANTGEISLGYELLDPSWTFSVNSTERPVRHGALRFYHTWRLSPDDGSYTYDLEFSSDGVIPNRSVYDVSPDQLATIDATYRSNVTGVRGLEQRFSFLPWQTFSVRVGSSAVEPPLRRTEYVIADPSIIWLHDVVRIFSIFDVAGEIADSYRAYHPGQRLTEVYNAPPITPGVQRDFGANPGPFVCTACRRGATLSLLIYPFGDNQPGHVGTRDGVRPGSQVNETTEFTIYQGDTMLAHTDQALGSIDLPDERATYRLAYHNTRSAPWWTLSTDTRTEWTITSGAEDGTGQLPDGWVCAPDGGTDCGIVPLLFARYELPVDDLGVIASGTSTARVTIAHAQGAPDLAASLELDASYDGGATWTPLEVTADQGNEFTVHLDVPAAENTDGYLALRLRADDTHGSALDQTVLRAAAVGPVEPATVGPVDLGEPTAPSPAADTTPACAPATATRAACFAVIRRTGDLAPNITGPDGYGPADLRDAYGIAHDAPGRGAGQTIAVVGAFDNPTAEADLAEYREHFGLPPCGSDTGCFTKLNQRGGTDEFPRRDTGWSVETSLDLDMVSAACPLCRLVLVEADSNKVSDLAAAVDIAADRADVVTNSYGTDEFTGMSEFAGHYQHENTFMVVASGDAGFTYPQFPAVLPNVLAVGGTSLNRADNARGWEETAWGNGANSTLAGGAGSGCSGYVPKPRWQHDRDCLMRTTADVAAVGDPNTGVAVYTTAPGRGGWIVVGGTSAAAPFVAGVIGLAEDGARLTTERVYRHAHDFHDVVGGSAGYCEGSYLCTGAGRYDGPTGLGSPRGIGAF